MAISKELLDELLKDYKGPEDITGPEGLLKQLTKALIERAMDAEMTDQLGYEKSDQAERQDEENHALRPGTAGNRGSTRLGRRIRAGDRPQTSA